MTCRSLRPEAASSRSALRTADDEELESRVGVFGRVPCKSANHEQAPGAEGYDGEARPAPAMSDHRLSTIPQMQETAASSRPPSPPNTPASTTSPTATPTTTANETPQKSPEAGDVWMPVRAVSCSSRLPRSDVSPLPTLNREDTMTLLQYYFERIQRRLLAEGEAANAFHHSLNRGQIREAFIREFLVQNISDAWGVGTG